jgi:hypothetical protein
MRKLMRSLLVVMLLSSVFFACKKDQEDVKTTGKLIGTITDAETNSPLANARIIVFDANTNAPAGITLTTGSDGKYSAELLPGNYYVKIYRQGYENIPAREVSALPFSIVIGHDLDNSYKMFKSAITDGGFISGKLISGGNPVAGVLVVAANGANGFSSVTDKEGKYVIYNVPAASYTVKGWIAGYNSSEATTTVTAGAETANVDLALTQGANGQVTGQISFLATGSVEIDVALTHPATKETIPGLSKITSGGNYTISHVPDGKYLARATYANDTKVMDPDWIIKNGEPFVTVTGASITRNFSVTGAVELANPTNISSTTEPVATSATPTFSWLAYASTDDYVIEVMNANGKVIWGGFSNNYTTKNISIVKSQTSIQFNADGKATEALQPGQVYRWRIYASKNDIKELITGWKLISVSEDQRGLIKIAQ